MWITNLDGSWMQRNGQVLSAYFHPTLHHAATTVGKGGTVCSNAGPGKWAVSLQTKGLFGNKAFYKVTHLDMARHPQYEEEKREPTIPVQQIQPKFQKAPVSDFPQYQKKVPSNKQPF
jgi:hypothetical protein